MMSKNLAILGLIFSISIMFSVSGAGAPVVFYSLSSPEVSGPYTPGDTVVVRWNNVENVACKANPTRINIEYYDETDGISLEVISYPFSKDRESDYSHVVGYAEAGDTIKVYIYYADSPNAKHGDSGTYCEVSDTYTVAFQQARKSRIVVLANSIDYALASDFFGFLRNRGMDVIHSTADNFDQYKNEKFIVILGGPDAYQGVREIVREVLTTTEQNSIREKGNRKMYVKTDLWTTGQSISVIAGSDRYQTQQAHRENKDEVALEADGVTAP